MFDNFECDGYVLGILSVFTVLIILTGICLTGGLTEIIFIFVAPYFNDF